MLLEKIKNDALDARKARDADKAALLTTLFADAARVGKDDGNRASTDEEVVRTVQKFLKGVEDSLAVLKQADARARAEAEKAILVGYLPRQVTGAELKSAVDAIVATLPERSPKQMGVVMKQLRVTHAGAYDGNEASTLVKAALAG